MAETTRETVWRVQYQRHGEWLDSGRVLPSETGARDSLAAMRRDVPALRWRAVKRESVTTETVLDEAPELARR